MMAEKQYNFATNQYTRLCEARRDHSFWMANIIDATVGMTDDIAWQNFYTFISDDKHVFKNSLAKTLGQCIDEGESFPDCPIQFQIDEVQNGDVTHVKLTPNVYCINKTYNNGKSVVEFPPRIQEEKSGLELTGSDEKR